MAKPELLNPRPTRARVPLPPIRELTAASVTVTPVDPAPARAPVRPPVRPPKPVVVAPPPAPEPEPEVAPTPQWPEAPTEAEIQAALVRGPDAPTDAQVVNERFGLQAFPVPENLPEAPVQKEDFPEVLFEDNAPLPGLGHPGRLVDILMPVYRGVQGPTMFATCAALKQFDRQVSPDTVGLRQKFGNAMIYVVRNQLVHEWLTESESPWCLFLDDDMLPPIGNANWFWATSGTNAHEIPERVASQHFLKRLLAHQKPLVSACCFGRSRRGRPVFGAAFADDEVRKSCRRMDDRLVETDWAGTGCLLVHRKVFAAIRDAYPELRMDVRKAGYAFDYFRPTALDGAPVGEDAAFGLRAKKAGFTTQVDLGLQVLHIGNNAFGPHNTAD